MTDLNPEIWDNETLGAAANNTRLEVVEKQELENRNAKLEGREPREVIVDNNYPGWTPDVNPRTGTVPSNAQVVHFADENQNDVPVDSGPESETAAGVSETETETDDSEEKEESETWS